MKAIMEDCFSNLKLDRFTPIRTVTGGLWMTQAKAKLLTRTEADHFERVANGHAAVKTCKEMMHLTTGEHNR